MSNEKWKRIPHKGLFVLVGLLVILAMAVAACGGDDDESVSSAAADADDAPAAEAAAPAEEAADESAKKDFVEPEKSDHAEEEAAPVYKEGIVDMGVVAPESGNAEVYGHTYAAAAKLVEHEVNTGSEYCVSVGICEPGGGVLVGDTVYKLKFHIKDDRSDINAHVAYVTELVRDVGIKFCMCGTPHDFAIASSKVTQPAGVMHFSGSSTLEELLTPDAVQPGGDTHYLFQTETREYQRSGSVAKGAIDLIDPNSKVSVILMANDATGQFLGSYLKRALEANGQTVPDIIYWDHDTTDFTPLFTRAKKFNPDILHFWYDPNKAIAAIPQALEIGVANSGYFMFGIDPGEYAKNPVDTDMPIGMACVPMCWGASSRAEAAEYWKRYEAVGNELRSFSSVSLLTYDDYYMLFRAWKEAGTVEDTDLIVPKMLNRPWKGVIGDEFTYDYRHIVSHGTEVCVKKSDGFTCQFTPFPTEAPPGTPKLGLE